MFRDFLEVGGPLMWPLLGCSVLLTAVLVERLLTIGVWHRLLRRPLPDRRRTWHRSRRGAQRFTHALTRSLPGCYLPAILTVTR